MKVQFPVTLCALVGFAALLFTCPALSGGFQPDKQSVEFVGMGSKVLAARQEVQIRFKAASYLYGSDESAYVVFLVAKKKAGPLTQSEIQDAVTYGMLVKGRDATPRFDDLVHPFTLTIRAPETAGEYVVYMPRSPHFRRGEMKSSAGYRESFVPHHADRQELLRGTNALSDPFVLTSFRVSSQPIPVSEAPTLYLRVNGSNPASAKIKGGLNDNPLVFSWKVGPEFTRPHDRLRYRFQLYPSEDHWSAWVTQSEIAYFFLSTGAHQFKVQARYSDDTQELESNPAVFEFAIDRPLTAKPSAAVFRKGAIGLPEDVQPGIDFGSVYAKSRALLVGIWDFDDAANFAKFSKSAITSDLNTMQAALAQHGFEVSRLDGERTTREDIANALEALVNASGKDDRLFVYFSTHGFADKERPAEGYLATSNCRFDAPSVACYRLNDLGYHASRALDSRKVRQVLFAVDSCFSGLGIVQKSAGAPDLARVAVPQGAYMLTAGMANQTAQIDPQLGKSTFTHFLSEGLKGKAKIYGANKLMTLTELYVYVQYEVASRTASGQIPMLGRLKGEGEMLFRVN